MIRLFDHAISHQGWLVAPIQLGDGNFKVEIQDPTEHGGIYVPTDTFPTLTQAIEHGKAEADKAIRELIELNLIYALRDSGTISYEDCLKREAEILAN